MAGGSRLAVAVLCGVQFVDVLGVTSAITALPAMLAGVSAPAGATAVLATVYAMFFGGLLVLGARLGDRYGHRRVLLTGCLSFALVSLVGAGALGLLVGGVLTDVLGWRAVFWVNVPIGILLVVPSGWSSRDRRRSRPGRASTWPGPPCSPVR